VRANFRVTGVFAAEMVPSVAKSRQLEESKAGQIGRPCGKFPETLFPATVKRFLT
jgi:hypothetical protein